MSSKFKQFDPSVDDYEKKKHQGCQRQAKFDLCGCNEDFQLFKRLY